LSLLLLILPTIPSNDGETLMPFWLARQPLVLASKSPSRRAILEGAGLPFAIMPADIDERALEAGLPSRDPGAIASALAREKAHVIATNMPGRLVLGADQTLALGQRLFTKPDDIAAAREQLKALRGRTHELHAALALARDGSIIFEHREIARLTMRDFSDDFLEVYLAAAGSAVTASVGAYQIEANGIHLFDKIDGDQFTIMGLPLIPLLDFLRRDGCLAA
jgi:septum formation protein